MGFDFQLDLFFDSPPPGELPERPVFDVPTLERFTGIHHEALLHAIAFCRLDAIQPMEQGMYIIPRPAAVAFLEERNQVA